ncbi:MAG: lysoplasmalogenase [Sphingomonas sp.]|uniref:lysoplasmalogenase n=1 Tax=Sphingomonas sp. TaxID=28214 RepID=UPI001ACEEC4A|nr:lysoplasmalogenase [Sphingomonas sp.]MBN8814713.1 lysoplasmalogenase [Sphingomonas sp.]
MTSNLPRYSLLFAAALIAGASFWIGDKQIAHGAAAIAWKGSGVALLALWAALNARSRDGWQIALVLALGAIGDVLLELSRDAGAAAFLAGHIVAAALYWRHRRTVQSASQTTLAVLLLMGTPFIAFLLPADRAAAPLFAIYALGLGAMAGSAWASSFPRYRVGLGAAMFAASDLLIFAKLGPLATSPLPGWLIWPLYFAGQALIAWGAVTTILRWKADDDLHHRL